MKPPVVPAPNKPPLPERRGEKDKSPAPPQPKDEDAPRPHLDTEGRDNVFATMFDEPPDEPAARGDKIVLPSKLPREARDLGRPTSEYGRHHKWLFPIVVSVLIVVGIVATIYATIVNSRQPPKPLPPGSTLPEEPPLWFTLALGGSLTVLGGAAGMVVAFNRVYQRIILCENGFLDVNMFKVRVVRYEDIESVYESITRIFVNGAYRGTAYVYKIDLGKEQPLVYDSSWVSAHVFGKRIQAEACREERPVALKKFRDGKWVDFGRVRVHKRGIEIDRDRCDWDMVEEITGERGFLILRERFRKGEFARVAFAEIPNLPVFLDLIAEVTGHTKGDKGE